MYKEKGNIRYTDDWWEDINYCVCWTLKACTLYMTLIERLMFRFL